MAKCIKLTHSLLISFPNSQVYSVNIDADNLNEDKEKTEKEIILNKQSGVLLSEKAEESYFQAKPSSSNVSEVSKSKNEAKNGVLCKFESYNIKLSENVNENDFQNEVFTSNASDLHYDTDEIQNGIVWGCNNPDTASGSENREEKNLQIESFIGGSTDVERNEENKRHDARGSYGECPTVLLPEDIEKDLSTRSLIK